MEFISHETRQVTYLTSPNLTLPGLRHAFSTRLGGVSRDHLASLNLRGPGPSGDLPERVEENYRRFCRAVGLDESRVVLSKQVHEDTVRAVTAADAGKGLRQERDYTADALVTNVPNLPLFVFSADCVVILLYDPRHRAVGAVHSGWRGTALGILKKTVETMSSLYGTSPADLLAAIGPAIGPCCFETHRDVPDALTAAMGQEASPFIQALPGGEKFSVDLKGVNQRWLELAGVPREHIAVCPLCTACRPDLFWSHRRMGDRRGVQAAAVMLEEKP